ncbi:Aldehyde/histidinol dehydrogenase [Mucor mucedo]|uniref:Aldehyde/histidinol dehydrogenase n=1 Tax=Mucor mucedo TaxID=29922 RepID=UPI002220DE1D|nr:Aldehyde/histidinol dehydrogenase [Mucor mucedo]KAI7890561.1 Aldehyde/histidinol dehydrogenase [Mucor mucedo]
MESETTTAQWLAIGAGAFISWLVFNWISTPSPKKFTVEAPEAADPKWTGKILETPTIRNVNDPSNIVCYDPSTGYHIDTIPSPSAEKVKELYTRTAAAQVKWAETTFEQRRTVLRSLLAFVVENQETICQVGCRDTGKTMVDASLGEVITTCAKLRWTIDNAEVVLANDYRSPGLMMMYKDAKVVYQPLGVVSALVSWNYPFHNAIGPVISALASGNAIIVKCSEYVAWSSAYYEKIIKTCLSVNGFDPDLVQFISGFADVGEEVVKCGVDHVTFIGSPAVGKLVQHNAADNLIPCVLELGGKDCAILLKDADLVKTIPILMRGVFQNCGQNCVGIERILVASEIYDKVVNEMNDRIGQLRQGSILTDGEGVDCGAMTMGNQFERLEALVQEAVSRGARLLRGGHRYQHPKHKQGQYFEPTLLVDVTDDMEIANHEVFAPIMVIMKHNGPEDAVRITNRCPFGLGSSVFSADKSLAEKMCLQLRVGMSNVNDFAVNYLCQGLPFGGVGISGYGRFAGPEGLRGLCVPKAVTTDRIPGIKTSIPPILDYPIQNGSKSWKFVQGLNNMIYNPELAAKANAVVELIKASF